MFKVSDDYKKAMDAHIRDVGYINVTLGLVNNEAQEQASFDSVFAYWGDNSLPLRSDVSYTDYATLEEDYLKADGTMVFLPRDDAYMQLSNTPLTTNDFLGAVTINFGDAYSIKGFTIDFGDNYPSEFSLTTDEGTFDYTLATNVFETTDVLGDTTYVKITPKTMLHGDNRLRIRKVIMGVGLSYGNNEISSSNFEDFVDGISSETPYRKFDVTILDKNNQYDIDNDNSFINFLAVGQAVSIAYGMTLENGNVEWVQKASLLLSDWQSKKGEMSFSAESIFDTMTDKYTAGSKIYTRTAYEEAIAILTDFGLEADEYIVDDCLTDITLTNPMPEATHKECLQLLCNATRCILTENYEGKVVIKANFANVIEPDDVTITATLGSAWSQSKNLLTGSTYVYADLTRGFTKVDGSMIFLPRDSSAYLSGTGYVTEEIADSDGNFTENPLITLELPARYTYYGLYLNFDGNPPQEMVVRTYSGDTLLDTFDYTDLVADALLNDDYLNFDRISFEIAKAQPNDRVLIRKISFGDLSDYTLKRDDMLDNPQGYAETTTKDVYVKIFTFEEDEEGKVKEVEDDVYYKQSVSIKGENKYCENQLIATKEHAQLIAEWLSNYYANNKSYDVSYRGSPELDAADIIFMESEAVSNLQVEIETHKLSFNGAFSGNLSMRRAMRM